LASQFFLYKEGRVVSSQKDILGAILAEISKSSGITREALYKALKPNTKPRFDTVSKVLAALGMRMTVHA
jgi:probable addiction module antidote protein